VRRIRSLLKRGSGEIFGAKSISKEDRTMAEEGKKMQENQENKSGQNNQQKEGKHMGEGVFVNKEGKQMKEGIFISKKSLWLVAGGALGALAAIGIGKASKKFRPAVVGAVKEGYAFKEWTAGKIDRVKEDVEDIVAEAKHAYHKDIEATQESVKKEKEILQKVEEAVEKKATKKRAKKEG
jgi:hypothetical protein